MWEITLSSKIALVLEFLSDGEWHESQELLKLGVADYDFKEIIGFLNKYGLVKVHAKNRKVKINKEFRKLLTQTVA